MILSSGRDFRRRAVFSLMLIAATMILPVFSQEEAEPVINRIIVKVDGRPAADEFLGLVPIKPGDEYSLQNVNKVIQNLFQTGIFSDVKVLKSGQDKIDLTFELSRNLIVNRINIKGSPVRKSKLLAAVETMRPGMVLIEASLARAREALAAELQRYGYFEAKVGSEVIKKSGEAQADVLFTVSGWRRYFINSIEIQGSLIFRASDLARKIKSRQGRVYSPAQLEKDIQTLRKHYESQGYRRASVELVGEDFDREQNQVSLVIKVVPQEKITININGSRLSRNIVLPIWEERVFEDWALAEGEARLLNNLRKKGYLFVTVNSRLERQEGEINVIYDVLPGKRYSIENVVIEGATVFSVDKIKQQLAVVEKAAFFSWLSYDRLFALPADVELFYKENGFPDAKAGLEFETRKDRVIARLKIEEGQRQIVKNIIFSGNASFSDDEIKKDLEIKEGGPFFLPQVQREVERIESFYLERGFRGPRIEAEVKENEKNSFTVHYKIEEGQRFKIGRILMLGNRRTRSSVIKKEILLSEGDYANFSLVQESVRRLDRLGIFSEIKLEEIPISQDEEVLIARVREGEQNSASVGVGFETREDVRSLALWTNTYRPRGLGEYTRSNVFGLAAQFSVLGQYGPYEKRLIGSFSQPYLFGLPIEPSLIGWYEFEDRISFAFERRGFSMNTISRLKKNLNFLTMLRWSRTRLTRLDISESEIDRKELPYSTALGSITLMLDKRNDIFNPDRGYFFSAVGEVASPLFGTESDYFKTFIKFQFFDQLAPRLILGLTSRAGLGSGNISIPERFFAGGSSSFRGETFDQLGPKDPETAKPVGGKAILLVNTELSFPVLPALTDLSGVAFIDVGNVFSEVKNITLAGLETAVGAGLRYRTPLGPLRFELAWKLWDRPKRTKPLFFITIGNVF